MTKYIIEFLFISIIGTILHFTYQLSNKNKIVGLISSKNESTWEHIKIALTPSFIFLLLEIPFSYKNCNFIFSKFVAITTIIIMIPTLFYGYRFLLKKDIPIIDISIFYISILISILMESFILKKFQCFFSINYISLIIIVLIFSFYLVTNCLTPKTLIFKKPSK
ncbi:MAG: hypothetical protein IJ574_00120 [Bacilli bacterium]|nr:hypothetical protein [Bacilli bacterium]